MHPIINNKITAKTQQDKFINIYREIDRLIQYAVLTELIQDIDIIYTRNRMMECLKLDDYLELDPEKDVRYLDLIQNCKREDLEDILRNINDYAFYKGIITENTVTSRDLFDTSVMSILVPRPSEVVHSFYNAYEVSAEAATDYYYRLCQDNDYIRRYRIMHDIKWKTETQYGELDITINLSKPEKDPKEIAAAKNAADVSYPKCLLCMENEGYAGRMNHPARQNHRIIPITIQNKRWGLQYSPYVYYNEHCIVINGQHVPMQIDRDTFVKLMDFIHLFPHYFLGSNADLPIVGGSILSHDHFQGGHYEFPMARAEIEHTFIVKGFEDIEAGIVKWPMSVIRIRSTDSERLIDLADYILNKWRGYSDEEAFIFAQTDGELHNTITPIARKRGNFFEFDLALRNNITTKEHPMGLFHPHADLHHIKKENIGLIEVMGLAILPSRLKMEMELLIKAILEGKEISNDALLGKHAEWIHKIMNHYEFIDEKHIKEVLQKEMGLVFLRVLEDAGVFKRDEAGFRAWDRFLHTL